MELVKLLWILIFFLFSLTLIFIWSKIYVLSKKLQELSDLLKKTSDLDRDILKLNRPEDK